MIALLLAAAAVAVNLSGARVIVVQPIGAIPHGVTIVVTGLNTDKVNFIDSPDAICQRTQGGVSLLCRGFTAAAIAKHGTIWARLPYSATLYAMTGAPKVTR